MHFYAFEMYDRVYLTEQNGSKEAKVRVMRTRGNRNEFVLVKKFCTIYEKLAP